LRRSKTTRDHYRLARLRRPGINQRWPANRLSPPAFGRLGDANWCGSKRGNLTRCFFGHLATPICGRTRHITGLADTEHTHTLAALVATRRIRPRKLNLPLPPHLTFLESRRILTHPPPCHSESRLPDQSRLSPPTSTTASVHRDLHRHPCAPHRGASLLASAAAGTSGGSGILAGLEPVLV